MKVYSWMPLICNCILFVVSLVAFILVVVVRKRKEYFIILTLAFYMVFSGVVSAIDIRDFSNTEFHAEWMEYLLYFAQFLYMMAHWLFSSQYLRTSKTFPRLLSQAKLEYAAHDNKRDNRVSGSSSGFDVNAMQEELAL